LKKEIKTCKVVCNFCEKPLEDSVTAINSNFGNDIDICYNCLKSLPLWLRTSNRELVVKLMESLDDNDLLFSRTLSQTKFILFLSADWLGSIEVETFDNLDNLLKRAISYFEEESGEAFGEWDGYRVYYGFKDKLYRITPKVRVEVEAVEEESKS